MATDKNKTQSMPRLESGQFIRGLRGALPYLEDYRGETFVVKLAGETLYQPNLPAIIDDIILLGSVGIKIVLVHGAWPQIQQELRRELNLGQKSDPSMSDFEPDAMADVSTDIEPEVLQNAVRRAVSESNWSLMSKLSAYGRTIFPISGHFVQAQKSVEALKLSDRHTGMVSGVDTLALQAALQQGYLPVLPPFSSGDGGMLLYLDATRIALEAAVRLRARKLIILSSQKAGAIICKPIGKDLPSSPTGKLIVGRPAKFAGVVNMSL